MDKRFKNAMYILKVLQNNKHDAVIAGGWVRDKLIGVPSKDIDIATSAKPEEVEALFEKTIPIGKAFGIISVIINEDQFEIATFRSDGNSLDGRHPDSITFSSMEEDAERRDLTINGMFYDPFLDFVIDFVKGKQDIKDKVIKFIGNPRERIQEDYLRMLRAIRFAIKLDFKMESDTFRSIIENSKHITKISSERIKDELIKMFRLGKPRNTLYLLSFCLLLEEILIEVYILKFCDQNPGWHPEGNVWEHTIIAMENIFKNNENPSDELIWATLLHDIGKPTTQTVEDGVIRSHGHAKEGADIARKILKRLKFSNDFIEKVTRLIYDHMGVKEIKKMKKSTFRKYLAKPYIEDLIKLAFADSQACGIKSHTKWYNTYLERKEKLSNEVIEILPSCFVNGNDLIRLGFKPGPKFKKILGEIMELQLNEEIKCKDDAINYIKKIKE